MLGRWCMRVALCLAVAVAGCAAPPGPAPDAAAASAGPTRYRCDQGIGFTVRFEGDSALVDAGAHGQDTLMLDAGGISAQQTVFSNRRLRAHFGLGAGGAQALLQYAQPPLLARCARD